MATCLVCSGKGNCTWTWAANVSAAIARKVGDIKSVGKDMCRRYGYNSQQHTCRNEHAHVHRFNDLVKELQPVTGEPQSDAKDDPVHLSHTQVEEASCTTPYVERVR